MLLVEDDVISASALRSILSRRGWRVTDVATIAMAMVRLADPIDVLILDLMLPDGDGVEILRQVRRLHPHCRVAVTTGVSDPERIKIVSDLNPQIILRKPIDLDALLRFLEPPPTQ